MARRHRMWKASHLVLFAVFLSTLILSCREFIEPLLTNRKVTLLAPSNKSESGQYLQNFWWEPVDGALSYRLQIVTPSFDSISRLIADTLVRKDQFRFLLEPGRYQWRVRAENGSSRSEYSLSSSFVIHFSTLSKQQVQLKLPAANTVTANGAQLFSWEKLFSATRYRFQLDTNNFADESKMLVNSATPAQQFSFNLAAEKAHQWRVRAENDTAQSQWSTIYRITFDKTPPGMVALSLPANNAMVSNPVSLQWQATSAAKSYELMVFKGDSATVAGSQFPLSLPGTSHSFTQGNVSQKFYWKVRAVDEAGNKGEFSITRNFTVQ